MVELKRKRRGRAQPPALAVLGFGCFVPDLTRLPSHHARRPVHPHFSLVLKQVALLALVDHPIKVFLKASIFNATQFFFSKATSLALPFQGIVPTKFSPSTRPLKLIKGPQNILAIFSLLSSILEALM